MVIGSGDSGSIPFEMGMIFKDILITSITIPSSMVGLDVLMTGHIPVFIAGSEMESTTRVGIVFAMAMKWWRPILNPSSTPWVNNGGQAHPTNLKVSKTAASVIRKIRGYGLPSGFSSFFLSGLSSFFLSGFSSFFLSDFSSFFFSVGIAARAS